MDVIPQIGVHVIRVAPPALEAVQRALARHPSIEFAEKNRIVKPSDTIPDDPRFSEAWHLAKIDAPAAWDTAIGQGVVVAVLDTGVDGGHPDLQGRLVPGWNTVWENSTTSDVHGHGTKVAGTVAAATNNGIGVASVAWGAKVMPIRVTNRSDGRTTYLDLAEGLTWAADQGTRVANISFGPLLGSLTLTNGANYFKNAGGIVFVAADNTGGDPGFAENTSMVSVSATRSDDRLASFSSFGAFVDISAPGVDIWTTRAGGSYGTHSGTSFSSPVAAGVGALVLGINGSLSPGDVEQIIEASSMDLGPTGRDDFFGYGRVDADAAVAMATNSTPQDLSAPSATIEVPGSGAKVSGAVTVEATATDNVGVTSVQLLINDTLHATDLTEPYRFEWDTTVWPDGPADLVARAADAAGNTGRSDPVDVEIVNDSGSGGDTGSEDDNDTGGDTVAPIVVLTEPLAGEVARGTIHPTAVATDDVGVTRLKIFVDGVLICTSTGDRLKCGWNSRKADPGTHTASATAEDAAGNAGQTSVQFLVL